MPTLIGFCCLLGSCLCFVFPSIPTFSLGNRCYSGADKSSGVPRNFVRGGGFQQIQLRTEDSENGDLGAVAP